MSGNRKYKLRVRVGAGLSITARHVPNEISLPPSGIAHATFSVTRNSLRFHRDRLYSHGNTRRRHAGRLAEKQFVCAGPHRAWCDRGRPARKRDEARNQEAR